MIRHLATLIAVVAISIAVLSQTSFWQSLQPDFLAKDPVQRSLPIGSMTSNYSLEFRVLDAPDDFGNGGGIAVLDNSPYILTRRGEIFVQDRATGQFSNSDISTPLDFARIEAAFDRPIQKNSTGYKDILLRKRQGLTEITLSYTDIGEDGDCFGLVVARSEVNQEMMEQGGSPVWEELYRSTPCIATNQGFVLQAGGALAYAPDDTLYVFVGDFGLDSFNRHLENAGPQDAGSHMGKVIALRKGLQPEVHTIGHRNPGGLIAMRDGRVFVTEHGPRGGDELNLLQNRKNYGWPLETYGAHYGELTWPLDDTPGRQDEFERPFFAWVPSIAVSSVVEVQGGEFPIWDSDLMVASLRDQALHRLRIRDGRVLFSERFEVGSRVRDMAVGEDGKIYVKLDTEAFLLVIENANDKVSEIPKGLAQCVGCHQVQKGDQTEYVGPSLVGVLGRNIASVDGFEYSSALLNTRGSWDEARLSEFLLNLETVAPGSSMPQLDLGWNDVRFAVEALQNLRSE